MNSLKWLHARPLLGSKYCIRNVGDPGVISHVTSFIHMKDEMSMDEPSLKCLHASMTGA